MTGERSGRMHVTGLRFGAALALTGMVSGCVTVGPNYTRPVVTTPDAYRGASTPIAADAQSIADTKWTTLFEDEALQRPQQPGLLFAGAEQLARGGRVGGQGVLVFKGKQYPFSVSGMSVGFTIGASTSKFVGRAPEQVDEFIAAVVTPIRERYAGALTATVDGLKV